MLVFSVCGKAILTPEYLGGAGANNELVKLVTEMTWTSMVQANHSHMIGTDVIYVLAYF